MRRLYHWETPDGVRFVRFANDDELMLIEWQYKVDQRTYSGSTVWAASDVQQAVDAYYEAGYTVAHIVKF